MSRRPALRIAVVALLAAGGSVWAPPARADVRLDAAFVDMLARPGAKRHPLADRSGKLPVVLELPAGADARAMGWLPLGAGLAAVRLRPSELAGFEASHPGVPFSIWPGLHPVLDESTKLNGTSAYRASLARIGSPVAGTGKGVVVGIVDMGIDATHADFRDAAGRTRIAWLLDFSKGPAFKHAELETKFGCDSMTAAPCAVFDKADIDQALEGAGSALPSDVVGHGTHVASIAAGNGGPEGRFVGGAPEAALIVASVGNSGLDQVADVDIVTAARFIFDRADQMGVPAVLNISLGGDFGPHDGTTPLEKALADLVGPSHPGRSIVVAAGNSGALFQGDRPEQTLGIHTEARVTRNVPAKIPIFFPDAGKNGDISGSVYVWLTYRAGDVISVGLRGPGGLSIPPVAIGKKGGYQPPDNAISAGVYNGPNTTQPLTSDTHGAIVVWDGHWPASGEMVLDLDGEGFVDAWIESALDNASSGNAYFEAATRQGTVSVPATHPELLAVGCTTNRSRWIDRDSVDQDLAQSSYNILAPADGSCYFSSAGPTATGVQKPEISAPGAMVAGAMSRDVASAVGRGSIFDAPPSLCKGGGQCLVIDASHALLSGSSMSSPQVAGAIALLFERDATLTQPEIRMLLEQGARRPIGKIAADYQLGAGTLDVVGTMAALEARASVVPRDPDRGASWLSLSNNYAHPGTGPAVTGTVEVRAADAAIADGFDAARLSLVLGAEGVIAEPLSRIAPGLFRFTFSGRPESGSNLMRLDVLLDGAPIGTNVARLSGHRLIPIGGDRWIAHGTARAYGGCSVAGTMTPHRSAAWLGALCTVLFGIRRRTATKRRSVRRWI